MNRIAEGVIAGMTRGQLINLIVKLQDEVEECHMLLADALVTIEREALAMESTVGE